ncbi:MAG: hypothetical protein ABIQ52_01240 [Vicinamibacterales bacterium]
MLHDSPMYSYIPAKDVARARRFYEGKKYDMPGTDANGITTAGGAKAAWFKDPEGNILAVIQTLR